MTQALVLRGGTVLGRTGWLPECDVAIANGVITEVGRNLRADHARTIDVRDHRIVPGLVDVHLHGAGGAMFEEGREDVAEQISTVLARFGTTSVAATIAALPPDRLRAAVTAIARAAPRCTGARLRCIHLEGPFLNPRRAGAQQAAWMRAPSLNELADLQTRSGGMIRLLTLAPELPGAREVIAGARRLGIAVALGHSEASEDDVLAAIAAGATHVTHLFNAGAPLHHRAPGLIGTALTDDRLSVELIADGVHLHWRAIDVALRCKPADKVVLVSDGVAAVGMGEGEIELFGVACVARDAVRIRATGQLAGSRLTLDRALHNLREWFPGVPLERFVAAATTAPATLLGFHHRMGYIAPAFDADLIALTPALDPALTIAAGRVVYGS